MATVFLAIFFVIDILMMNTFKTMFWGQDWTVQKLFRCNWFLVFLSLNNN